MLTRPVSDGASPPRAVGLQWSQGRMELLMDEDEAVLGAAAVDEAPPEAGATPEAAAVSDETDLPRPVKRSGLMN